MRACVAEDRASEQVAVKLLVASLARHCPGLPVDLFFPPADAPFRRWLADYPAVTLHTDPPATAGWDIKPWVLLRLLEAGHPDVCWIDADIILTADLRAAVGRVGPDTVVATEEAVYGMYRDDGYRARAWGFPVGRPLPFALNTGVVRVTQAHLGLVRRWRDLLASDAYRRPPGGGRPFHLFSDQDVFTALLASREFAHLPVRVLHRVPHVVQYFGPAGYSLAERWAHLCGRGPALVHCQRDKPWRRADRPPPVRPLRPYLDYVRLEASPYLLAAGRYRAAVGEPMPWLRRRSAAGRALALAGLGRMCLTGLPLAAGYALVRLSKRLRGRSDRFDPAAAFHRLAGPAGATP